MFAIETDPAAPGDDGNYARTDRELLDSALRHQVTENRAHARRLDAIHTFHERRVAEHAPTSVLHATGRFRLTPLRETQAEFAPLLGMGDQMIQIAVDTTADALAWLPDLWDRFRAGRLDLSKILACLDQLTYLATDQDRADYAAAIQAWFAKHDPSDSGQPLCQLPREKIQRAARYQRLKLPKRSDQETFAAAFAKRRVSLHMDETTGMACLSATTAAHDALTADHRLTLIAKRRAENPTETRTLAQLRSDSLLDLIHGRLTVPATTGALEHQDDACDVDCPVNGDRVCSEVSPFGTGPEARSNDGPATPGRLHASLDRAGTFDDIRTPRGDEPPSTWHCPHHPMVLTTDDGATVGGYARSVVNVTVPITTLLGLDDQPGQLSGGIAIPADLARHIAADPASTWYRMLTDPVGNFVELSTTSYQPTDPIVRVTVSRDQTCVWPSCSRPSAQVHIDHRVPYPAGPTSTSNTQPLCQRHHQVKHAPGFSVERHDEGSYTWRTPFGSTFTTPASEQATTVTVWDHQPQRRRCQTGPRKEQRRLSAFDKQDQIDERFAALTSPLESHFAELLTRFAPRQ